MRILRQLRWPFGSRGTHGAHIAVLSILAAFAATEAPAQEPRFSVPSYDLFPLRDDPLNPQLPPAKAAAGSQDSQEPSILPAIPIEGTKLGQGRTEITADEAVFDPETHMATFREHVVLKDPNFNVVCDVLVAYLKHDQPPKPGARKTESARGALGAGAPKGGANPTDDPHRTLDKAVAEMHPGGRLEITQDKVETDGTVTHSIGHGSKAVYNAITGTTVLTGMPDATKGTDSVVATDENTVITLMRDGGMNTIGPHKVIIINKAPPKVKQPTP